MVDLAQGPHSHGWKTLIPRLALVFFLLYSFLCAVTMLGGTFKEMGEGKAVELVTHLSPLASLAVGILVTVLVQSSSVTTSLIVGVVATNSGGNLVEDISTFIPMTMGANIGTTVTNTLASMGHVTRSKEFERAFAGATMHDFFNLLTVIILLPIELMTGALAKAAVFLVETLQLSEGAEFESPIKNAVKAGAGLIKNFVRETLGITEVPYYVIMLALSVIIIFICLGFITKNMRVLMANRLEVSMNRALAKSGVLGMFIGLAITVAVQSSSITTSILVPMFGAGLLTHTNGFPIMLGANVGTTVTALMAAVVKGPAGLAIAFVHLLFNLAGILIFYPIPFMRNLPIRLAQALARSTTRSKWWILWYVGGVFIVIPLLGFLVFG